MTSDRETVDDLLLPPADKCAGTAHQCGLPKSQHIGWEDGGPSHDFVPPLGEPRPEHVASSSITTEWTCTHCGSECDVWGVADAEWMACAECGRYSFVCFMVGPQESAQLSKPARAA